MVIRCLFMGAVSMFASAFSPQQATPVPTFRVPNTNSGHPAGPPIQVEDCRLRYSGGLLLATTGNLIIEFTNEGRVAANLIRFRVTWGADGVDYIREKGHFSPGITIKKEYRQSEGMLISPLFSHPHVRCSIESIHFEDDSVWTRP